MCNGNKSKGRPTGRPSKFDPAATERVLEFIAEGFSVEYSCRATGISARSFGRWIDNDVDLFNRFARAQALRGLIWVDALDGDGGRSEKKYEAELDRCMRHCEQWLPMRLQFWRGPKKAG
jgi:hypothetical protein